MFLSFCEEVNTVIEDNLSQFDSSNREVNCIFLGKNYFQTLQSNDINTVAQANLSKLVAKGRI